MDLRLQSKKRKKGWNGNEEAKTSYDAFLDDLMGLW